MAMGNLAAAVPVGVLPQMTFTSFTSGRIFPMLATQYHDGTMDRYLISDTVNPVISIKSWTLSARLTSTALVTLRTFYYNALGGVIPFYFYDPFDCGDGAIGSNYDPTGTNGQGQYTVRFNNQSWQENTGLSRSDVSFSLVEVG